METMAKHAMYSNTLLHLNEKRQRSNSYN